MHASPATDRRTILFLALTALGMLVACGAKTGLEIEEFDAPSDAGSDAPLCRPGVYPVEPTRADLMLVLDRSGSMRLDFAGTADLPRERWRWTFLRDAIAETLPSLGERVRVGAKLYPDPIAPTSPIVTADVACRTSPSIDVRPSLDATAAILDRMDRTAPLGGTPTVEAVLAARGALLGSTEGRRFIIVATDGGPNCNPSVPADPATCVCTSARETCLAPDEGIYSCVDDPRTTEVLDETNRAFGIPVFVLGIPDESRPDLTDYLDRMAIAGGRARAVPGERAFYSARSPVELREAFEQITDAIGRCSFVGIPILGDDAHYFVEVDGERLERGPLDGWTWSDRARGEFELHGDACDRANRPGATIRGVLDACPDL